MNHMSLSFREVMTDISSTLKEVYNADAVAVVPGSGTFGMEAVARQFATNQNGWLSATAGLVIAGPRSLRWVLSHHPIQCQWRIL